MAQLCSCEDFVISMFHRTAAQWISARKQTSYDVLQGLVYMVKHKSKKSKSAKQAHLHFRVHTLQV